MTQISAQLWRRVAGCQIRFYSAAKTSKKWKSVVGLEVHAQISSSSKLFSGAKNSFANSINSSVALLDASIPSSLPVLNQRCVEAGVKTALAMSCQVNEVSMFDRKHYFYADLPAGYQITQQRAPLASNGFFTFPVFVPGVTKKPYYKTVRRHQLQLEHDSGKSLHDEDAGISLIDLNRAGILLMELDFDPDLNDGEETAALVKEQILILEAIETCNCRMEEGSLRVDANISIHKEGEPLGTQTEVKNIGSIRTRSTLPSRREKLEIISDNDEVLRLCNQVLTSENGQKMDRKWRISLERLTFYLQLQERLKNYQLTELIRRKL